MAAAGLVLATMCGVVACTGEPTARLMSRPPSTAASVPAAVEVPSELVESWRLDLPLIGEPVAVGDVAVVFSAADGVVTLVAVDARSGEQLWSQPVSPAYVVPGIEVAPEVVEDGDGEEYVAYYRPPSPLTSSLNAIVEVADARTGEDVATASGHAYTSPLRRCNDGLDVCFEARSPSDGTVTRRLPLPDGPVRDEPQPPGYIREIGPLGLSDLREGDEEFLARIEHGVERWRTPIDTAFGGPGYSTDGGWGWEHFEAHGLLIGTVGRAYVGGYAAQQVVDLALNRTVALDAETGAVRWRHDRSRLGCADTLPRPRVAEDAEPWPARCVYGGTITYSLSDVDPTFDDLDVVVQGFDPATGRATWEVPMGPADDLIYFGDLGGIANEREIVLPAPAPAPAGPMVVDLRSSAIRPPEAGEVFGCVTTVQFEYDDAYVAFDEPLTKRVGGTLVTPCRADGSPVPDPLPTATVLATATPIDGVWVLSTTDGLAGYVPP